MFAVGLLLVRMLCDLFKPRPRLEAEILILRHQLNVLRQRTPRRRLHLRWIDRALFIWLYRRYPRILDALSIVRPETVVRWHRKGFTGYWRWKSRSPGGRPRIAREVRDLIRRMSFENSLWGATRIHGELLKLGIAVAQSTVGHGGSPLWRELKDFVQDRLGLPWDEFNRVPVAGVTNIARLSEMLDAAAIAFLVMTAEDEMAGGAVQARMNVVHEAGLFQGRLGFTKAIVLLEEGCEEFSNIQGLGQIRFPKGKISAAFEEVRRVLEREGLIAGPE